MPHSVSHYSFPVIRRMKGNSVSDYTPAGILCPGGHCESSAKPHWCWVSDYSPFGSNLSDYQWVAQGMGYRYGFNSQEKDDEIYGAGNSYTAEYWQYDARLARRWNLDPVVKPWESPYLTFGGNPVIYFDIDGNDWDPRWPENFNDSRIPKIIVKNAKELYKESKVFSNAANRITFSNTVYTISPGYVIKATGGVNKVIQEEEKRRYEADPSNERVFGQYRRSTNEIVLHIFNKGYARKTTIFEETFHAAQDDYYTSIGANQLTIQLEIEAKTARILEGYYGNSPIEKQFFQTTGKLLNKYIYSKSPLTENEKSDLTNRVKSFAYGIMNSGYGERLTQEDWDYIDNLDIDQTYKYLKNEASK